MFWWGGICIINKDDAHKLGECEPRHPCLYIIRVDIGKQIVDFAIQGYNVYRPTYLQVL